MQWSSQIPENANEDTCDGHRRYLRFLCYIISGIADITALL